MALTRQVGPVQFPDRQPVVPRTVQRRLSDLPGVRRTPETPIPNLNSTPGPGPIPFPTLPHTGPRTRARSRGRDDVEDESSDGIPAPSRQPSMPVGLAESLGPAPGRPLQSLWPAAASENVETPLVFRVSPSFAVDGDAGPREDASQLQPGSGPAAASAPGPAADATAAAGTAAPSPAAEVPNAGRGGVPGSASRGAAATAAEAEAAEPPEGDRGAFDQSPGQENSRPAPSGRDPPVGDPSAGPGKRKSRGGEGDGAGIGTDSGAGPQRPPLAPRNQAAGPSKLGANLSPPTATGEGPIGASQPGPEDCSFLSPEPQKPKSADHGRPAGPFIGGGPPPLGFMFSMECVHCAAYLL